MKKCVICRKEKCIESFVSSSSNYPGERSSCDTCREKKRNAFPLFNYITGGKVIAKTCSKCGKTCDIELFKSKFTSEETESCLKCREYSIHANKRKGSRKVIKRGVESKTCRSCDEMKPLTEYGKDSKTNDGLKSYCKICRNEKNKIFRSAPENKERRIKQRKEYNSRPDIIQRRKEYNSNPDRKARVREWANSRRKENSDIQLVSNLRTRVRDAVVRQRTKKSAKTLELIGCSVRHLRKRLEKMFDENMNWDNYGLKGWVIDHIIPCASFDLTDPEQQRRCFHYTNLQPLWWWDNLEKSAKLDWKKAV